ncbi:putative M20/M25/M40-family peptidase [Actinoplanes missouriensis 431]|uniref:Putative M20/M25/M40-family peptidase n=1 Tax=Actinoplanes missouriensis (strain ATCC 14538 / DSM 43046 / CBS 188.64 / JCM 3121 / NBRC 102363 / NCIMB 12654 / NRRL B-3342 / UNCC 431) TaxID=512565 RepID=I0HI44_ACTM4|nr:amidohydrolase [Actinoplanes missouriensis]BAL92681.1 putative M20/M25/M40-family peptidase [Actinoplanes missouriensis 431]
MTTALTAPEGVDTSWPGPPPGADPLPGQLDRWLAARGAELVTIRRHIHAHPEPSHSEFETAALIARELTVAGLSPRLLPRGNGVICDIGEGDRAIAFRADIDALPLQDLKDVPYRSTVDKLAHACGHDVHTTVALGLGLALAQLNEQGELPGRVRLIFQPAEEAMPSGAPEVISAGALKDVSAIFALHCYPQLPAGLVGVRSGPFTAAADAVEVKLSGPGGHTARPHLTADLVHALGRVIIDVPSLLNRRIDPRAGISLVWGAVHAGQAFNAIPGAGEVRGTVRVLSREAWREAPELVTKLIHDVVAGTGAEVDVNYIRGVPPVINDRMASAIIAGAAGAALGADRVVEAELSMGGEDFSFYLEHVPGAMIRLGTAVPGSDVRHDLHQGDFDVDERAIGYGVRVMTHTALAALSSGAF